MGNLTPAAHRDCIPCFVLGSSLLPRLASFRLTSSYLVGMEIGSGCGNRTQRASQLWLMRPVTLTSSLTRNLKMVEVAGLEPTTSRFGTLRSILMSYTSVNYPKLEYVGLQVSFLTYDWHVDYACHSSPCGRKWVFCPIGVFNRFLLTECLADLFGQSLIIL